MTIGDPQQRQRDVVVEHVHTKFGDVHASGLYYLTLQVVRLSSKLVIMLMTPHLLTRQQLFWG